MDPKTAIVESKHPFPSWLKDHAVFKRLSRIEKVFPKIGLPNFKEDFEVKNTEVSVAAESLRNGLTSMIAAYYSAVWSKLMSILRAPEEEGKHRERAEIVTKLQYTYNLLLHCNQVLTSNVVVQMKDNRATLIMPLDIFDGTKPTVLFRKGQSLFKVMTALTELTKECGIPTSAYEDAPAFKNFSRLNTGKALHHVVFSSDGEEGAWDIATASMRGITSCQKWESTNARGLIGSVASKYLGIMYVASNTERVEPYGSKMLRRCMVRLIIHRTTRKPALYLDRMYPDNHPDFVAAFRKILHQKSGLEVFDYTAHSGTIVGEYLYPDEEYRSLVQSNEWSYMDSGFSVLPVQSPLTIKKKLLSKKSGSVLDLQNKIIQAVEGLIQEQRQLCIDQVKQPKEKTLPEYYMKIPANLSEGHQSILHGTKDGSMACRNMTHFFEHCDRNHPNLAIRPFMAAIFSHLSPKNLTFTTEEDVLRVFLRELVKNSSSIKEAAWKDLSNPDQTWMLSFPKAARRYLEVMMASLKKILMALWFESKK